MCDGVPKQPAAFELRDEADRGPTSIAGAAGGGAAGEGGALSVNSPGALLKPFYGRRKGLGQRLVDQVR